MLFKTTKCSLHKPVISSWWNSCPIILSFVNFGDYFCWYSFGLSKLNVCPSGSKCDPYLIYIKNVKITDKWYHFSSRTRVSLYVCHRCQGLLEQISANIRFGIWEHASLSFSSEIEGQSEAHLWKSGNLHTGCLLNGDSDKMTYGNIYRFKLYKENL